MCRLAGFFNEQPQMMALVTAPSARSPAPGGVDVELAHLHLAAAAADGGDGGRSSFTPLSRDKVSRDTTLAEASGRSEGFSSPVLREKALHGIGTLGAALEAELSRVAAWRQAKWEASKGWSPRTATGGGTTSTAAISREETEPLILGDGSSRIEDNK